VRFLYIYDVRFVFDSDADGRRDTLVYEYVGDVVSNPTFMKRMREYAEEGIEHFYFMMLQKDEVSRGTSSPSCWCANRTCLFLRAS